MEAEVEMKRILLFILPCILAACVGSPPGTATPADTLLSDLSPTTPTVTVAPETRPCRPADLKPGSQSNGATGNIFLGVWFINTSGSACYLQTWPQVTLLDPSGQPLQVEYTYWDMESTTPQAGATEQAAAGEADRLTLEAGQSAGFDVLWRNWCGPDLTGKVIVRVTLGEQTVDLPTDLSGGGRCDSPGAPSTVALAAFHNLNPSQ
jgi:hypothetical protein